MIGIGQGIGLQIQAFMSNFRETLNNRNRKKTATIKIMIGILVGLLIGLILFVGYQYINSTTTKKIEERIEVVNIKYKVIKEETDLVPKGTVYNTSKFRAPKDGISEILYKYEYNNVGGLIKKTAISENKLVEAINEYVYTGTGEPDIISEKIYNVVKTSLENYNNKNYGELWKNTYTFLSKEDFEKTNYSYVITSKRESIPTNIKCKLSIKEWNNFKQIIGNPVQLSTSASKFNIKVEIQTSAGCIDEQNKSIFVDVYFLNGVYQIDWANLNKNSKNNGIIWTRGKYVTYVNETQTTNIIKVGSTDKITSQDREIQFVAVEDSGDVILNYYNKLITDEGGYTRYLYNPSVKLAVYDSSGIRTVVGNFPFDFEKVKENYNGDINDIKKVTIIFFVPEINDGEYRTDGEEIEVSLIDKANDVLLGYIKQQ